VIHWRTK